MEKNSLKEIKFFLNTEIYPLESIINTCYGFVNRFYVFLDTGSEAKSIRVSLKGKRSLSQKHLDISKAEFMNELLHWAIRHKVSKNNKKLREYIVGRALYSALPNFDLTSSVEKPDYIDDPLGIAIPWEEKYGKKSAKSKV